MKNLIRISLSSALAILMVVSVISYAVPAAHACSTPGDCGVAIALTDTVSNSHPQVGDTITYTVSGSISLTDPATITVTDALESGLTFVSATSSIGTYSSSTGVWTLGKLHNGNVVSLTLVATVDPSASGKTIDNQPTVWVTDCTQSQAILGVKIYVRKATGTLATTVTGLRFGATSTVAVSDTASSTFSSSTVTGNTVSPILFVLGQGDAYAVTATTTAPGYAVTTSAGCAGASFATSTTCVVTFTLVAPPQASLSITKVANVTSTTAGDPVTYTLTATAGGPATSTDVTVTDNWPAGLTFVSASSSAGTSYASSTDIWTINDMPSGTVATLALTGTANPVTTSTIITNTATIGESSSSTNPNVANNTATSTIVVEPAIVGLSITKTISSSTPVSGSMVDYTLTVTASGNATSTDVVAIDNWPLSGLTFVSSTPADDYASSTGVWTINTMAPNSSATLDITALVTGNPGDEIINAASVSGNSLSGPDVVNSGATSTAWVASQYAALIVTKTVNNDDPAGGNTITYTITVRNLQSATSSDVMVQDALPNGLNFVSATESQGSLTNAGTLNWNVGDLAPEATATLTVSVVVNSSLDGQTGIANTALAFTTLDPTTILSSSTATIAVQAAPVNPPVNPVCTGSNCGGGGGGGGGGTVTGGGGGSAYEVAIDGGAPTTATTSATLSLYGTGAYSMEISNGNNFSSSTWQPYATTLPWTLTSGGGEKTVYVKYRDIQGNILATVNASIDLVQGRVLGAATSCGIYLNSYIKLGANNDKFEVEKLQAFLDGNLGIDLPVTGVYDATTYKAVEAFQLKYNSNVLSPWVPYGLTSDSTPTGYVYKTTQRWINLLMCNTLNLPMPVLP
jgi:uncharacterized repeat protein (TIGR01451 family)